MFSNISEANNLREFCFLSFCHLINLFLWVEHFILLIPIFSFILQFVLKHFTFLGYLFIFKTDLEFRVLLYEQSLYKVLPLLHSMLKWKGFITEHRHSHRCDRSPQTFLLFTLFPEELFISSPLGVKTFLTASLLEWTDRKVLRLKGG